MLGLGLRQLPPEHYGFAKIVGHAQNAPSAITQSQCKPEAGYEPENLREAMSAVIEVRNLAKKFDKAIAVEDISFTIEKGEFVGLLGQNGAGKSTTIQILLGLITPTSGDVRIFGYSPWKERVKVLERSNFSSAYVAMPPNLQVRENLEVFARLYGVRNRSRKIDELLSLFAVDHLARKMTGALSSGESTRVNLCKALLNDPELLLLDEPTASLDPDIADKVRGLLRQIQKERGLTVVYTSHNMTDVEELCHRVLFLHRGRIIAQGTPGEIVENLGESSLEEVFIAIARDTLKVAPGPSSVPGTAPDVAQASTSARNDGESKSEDASVEISGRPGREKEELC